MTIKKLKTQDTMPVVPMLLWETVVATVAILLVIPFAIFNNVGKQISGQDTGKTNTWFFFATMISYATASLLVYALQRYLRVRAQRAVSSAAGVKRAVLVAYSDALDKSAFNPANGKRLVLRASDVEVTT